jgi:hypothetical protein
VYVKKGLPSVTGEINMSVIIDQQRIISPETYDKSESNNLICDKCLMQIGVGSDAIVDDKHQCPFCGQLTSVYSVFGEPFDYEDGLEAIVGLEAAPDVAHMLETRDQYIYKLEQEIKRLQSGQKST